MRRGIAAMPFLVGERGPPLKQSLRFRAPMFTWAIPLNSFELVENLFQSDPLFA